MNESSAKNEKFRDSVLKSFIADNGRLKQIPAQLKKKLIVMEFLVQNLEVGRKYPEKEINEFIKNYHPDFATIRREFIMHHADRRLDQAQILRLSTGNFVHEKHNVIIMGASGAEKTYIGCALGISACRQFLAIKYIRLPELLTDLAVARGEGT